MGTSSYEPKIVADDLPEGYVKELEHQDATIIEMEQKEAAVMLKNAEIDAILTLPEGSSTLNINLEGSWKKAEKSIQKPAGSRFRSAAGETEADIVSIQRT